MDDLQFEWIDKHLGPEWLDKIVLTKDKTMVNGHILIDDRPNIKGKCFCFLFCLPCMNVHLLSHKF